ncbi:MAG: hypothetical protein AABX35_02375 [Nanoarchaeota archaeon]
MTRRIALEIKKKIFDILKDKEISIRELETKVDTNHKTTLAQLQELEYLGFVKITKHEKSEANGRPFTSVKLIKKP